jgi:periplasmic divalent cation tolerance protein
MRNALEFTGKTLKHDGQVIMKTAGKFNLVLVTAPDLKTARLLARAALDARLVACVNLVPKIESHYWWQGKLERGSEVLMILKATGTTLPELEALILKLHPYDTAEFVVLPVTQGSKRYLNWWEHSVRSTRPK